MEGWGESLRDASCKARNLLLYLFGDHLTTRRVQGRQRQPRSALFVTTGR